MELIDMYVKAVGERLHPSRQKDVEAELRASILDALEARGASPESEDDVVAVLAELGGPERMAAEYQPNRRYLIGPELFPLFRRVMRVVLVTLVMASMVGFGVTLLLGGLADFQAGELLMDTLSFALRAALVALVVLVAVFAWLQRGEVRLPRGAHPIGKEWDPRSLAMRNAAERVPRFDAVTGLVVAAVVLVILDGIGQAAREALPRAAAELRPLIQDGVVVNVLLLQVGLVLYALAHAIALVQGRWQTFTRGLRLVDDAIAVIVFVRVPLQLVDHRSGLVDAGLAGNQVNWLVASAIVVAAVLIGCVVAPWWRAWRRSRAGVSGRSLMARSLAI